MALLLFGLPLPALAESQADFESALELLSERSYDTKSEAVRKIVSSGHEQARAVLNAMLGGDLYTRKKEKDLVIAVKEGAEYRMTAVVTCEDLGLVKKRSMKKVSINNQLRGQLRGALALLNLDNPDAGERLVELAGREPQRIGLSATVRPIDEVGRFLVGPRSFQVVDE